MIRKLKDRNGLRLLVVRNDGLGDFILTLPLIAALKEQLPMCRITVLAGPVAAALAPMLPDIDEVIVDEGWLLKRHVGRGSKGKDPAAVKAGRTALEARIRAGRFDAAVFAYAEAASAALVHRAGVPLRAGPLRRAFFWRFNAFATRSRKGSRLSEYRLNLGLLRVLGLAERYAAPRLEVEPIPAKGHRPVVLHPYKRNETALSWPLDRFQALAAALAGAGHPVLVVGDADDEPVLAQHFGAMGGVRLSTGNTLAELVSLIAGAAAFVGNSSGPLHLAGLTGTPHVGLFPRNRVSAPARWATLPPPGTGNGSGHEPPPPETYLLSPYAPYNCVTCEREHCPYFNCVAMIRLDQVLAGLEGWGVKV